MSPVRPCKPIEAADTIESEKSASSSKSPVKSNSEQSPAARSRSNSIINLAPELNQQTIIKQRKIKSTKRQVAVLRPTIQISQSNNMAQVERMFDENANNTVFGSGKQSFATPTKLNVPEPSFFGQRSPQLSPLNNRAFSPSKVNKPKTKSVAEIIEGWPFKYTQKGAINDKLNRKIANETIVQTANCPEESSTTKNSYNEVNKENVPNGVVSGERYPKSLYTSPFTVTSRRLIRQKPQK